ncbi:unnamed protein product, partial [Callosobruchus maculatus]
MVRSFGCILSFVSWTVLSATGIGVRVCVSTITSTVRLHRTIFDSVFLWPGTSTGRIYVRVLPTIRQKPWRTSLHSDWFPGQRLDCFRLPVLHGVPWHAVVLLAFRCHLRDLRHSHQIRSTGYRWKDLRGNTTHDGRVRFCSGYYAELDLSPTIRMYRVGHVRQPTTLSQKLYEIGQMLLQIEITLFFRTVSVFIIILLTRSPQSK